MIQEKRKPYFYKLTDFGNYDTVRLGYVGCFAGRYIYDFHENAQCIIVRVCCFCKKTIVQRRDNDGSFELSGINGIFGGIIYIMVIATLSAAPVPVINLGRAAGTFGILCGVRKYRNAGGAVMGALTTCGVLLCNPLLAKNTLLLATSGLICGAFLQFGALITVLSFLGISTDKPCSDWNKRRYIFLCLLTCLSVL